LSNESLEPNNKPSTTTAKVLSLAFVGCLLRWRVRWKARAAGSSETFFFLPKKLHERFTSTSKSEKTFGPVFDRPKFDGFCHFWPFKFGHRFRCPKNPGDKGEAGEADIGRSPVWEILTELQEKKKF
jgi:hypothetical protein